MPVNRGYSHQLRKLAEFAECVVADAVACEPVSVSKFPINGKFNGNLPKKGSILDF